METEVPELKKKKKKATTDFAANIVVYLSTARFLERIALVKSIGGTGK